MTAYLSEESARIRKLNPLVWDAAICVLLGILFWVGRYWQFASFGLYEDDLTIIPRAVLMSFSELFRYIWSYIYHLYGHGRPLSDSLIYLFSNLGWRLDELKSIYVIGYLFTLVNIVLFYFLIRRVSNRNIALFAGVFYILYSADTTQAFLTHSLGAQPSIMLVLLALHAYLSNRKIIAYILAAIILFSYESPFLVFLGAPLLNKNWGRPIIKKFIIHAAILLAMLVAVYILRMAVGEGRVEGLTTLQLLTIPITHSVIGPVVSLGTYLYRPIQAIRAAGTSMIIAFVLSAVVFFLVFYLIKWNTKVDIKELASSLRLRAKWNQITEETQNLGKLFLAGMVMLIGAYPLTFTVRAYAISGRDTRVHLAGVMGAAIVVACAIAFMYNIIRHKKAGWVLSLGISVWAALLVSYGFMIQRDYRLGWQYQREFWTEMTQLVPDAGPDTVILVDPEGLRDVRQIGANTWNLPRILNQLYLMPPEWKNPPRVYRLTADWEDHIISADGNFVLNVLTVTAPASLYKEIPADQVIFIDGSNGRLNRWNAPLTIGNQTFTLRSPSDAVLSGLKHGLLYSMMIEDSRLQLP